MSENIDNLKPVALGSYLKALRLINGERVYDQAIRLGIAPFQISNYECGDNAETERDFAKEIVRHYCLSKTQAVSLIGCIETNEKIRKHSS